MLCVFHVVILHHASWTERTEEFFFFFFYLLDFFIQVLSGGKTWTQFEVLFSRIYNWHNASADAWTLSHCSVILTVLSIQYVLKDKVINPEKNNFLMLILHTCFFFLYGKILVLHLWPLSNILVCRWFRVEV